MENNSPFASQSAVLALLATPKREVTIARDDTPLESILASLTSFNYETEEKMQRFENMNFRHVAISAKTGKQYATYKTQDGKYKSFFTAQIQL